MKPQTRKRSAALGIAALAAALAMPAAPLAETGQAPAPAARADYRPDREECAALRNINAFREKRGRAPLAMSVTLGAAAEHHSEDMAARNYFSHDAPGGPGWDRNIRDHGYAGSPIGENIAAGLEPAGAAVKAWKRSPEHRRTMLDRSFRAAGIGRAFDSASQYGWYWTADFGGDVDREADCR